MTSTPGSGTRIRDKDASSTTLQKTPRRGLTPTPKPPPTNGRSTPVRGTRQPEPGSFVHANAAWGYETPAHKILTNIPSSITVRSSERRRRVKTSGSDDSAGSEQPLSTGFVESRYAKVKTPTPDSRMHVRSDSNASVVSERGTQSRKLAKVASFTSVSAGGTNKENFFHAKEVRERGGQQLDLTDKFFTADKARSSSPLPSTTPARQRKLSTSSQFSSFTSAKEVCQNDVPPTYSIPPLSSPPPQPRSPVSPTKSNFFHSNSSPAVNSPITAATRNNPPSPLRSNFITLSISPTPEPSSIPPPSPRTSPQSPPVEPNSSSSSQSSNPIELHSDTSEDETPSTKPLVPTTLDLENSARINRKIADLEISNSSLLAVNENLERTTREQAFEIRALKRQLRQSLRLSIVPHSHSPLQSPTDEDDEEEEDEEEGAEDEESRWRTDFRLRMDKCVFLSEQMLVEGRRGLEFRVSEKELVTGRVISGEWKEKEKGVEMVGESLLE